MGAMRLIVVLLLTAGLCSALQTGLQYTYHYRARVTSGIPEINDKRSAAVDVRADLIVSAPSARKVIFKLENVEYASYSGLSECPTEDMNEPLPVEYLYGGLGQREFALDGLGQLVFSEDEKNGTINFYKSIMQIFTIIPLKETFFGEEKKTIQRPSYTTTETVDSLLGTCELLYTQYHLSGTAAAQHLQFYEDHVEDDCQLRSQSAALTSKTRKTTGRKVPGRKTRPSKTSSLVSSCPTIEKDVYKLTRSIDLAACSDRVEYQHYLNGLTCDMASDQCHNLFSRNSHGTYFIRGDAEAMRVEKAEIKGTIVLSPYGYETEKLVSVSQQKIALVSVHPVSSDASMNFPTKTLNSLVFNMVVPSSVPTDRFNSWSTAGSYKDHIESWTDFEHTDEMREENVNRVIEMINTAAKLLDNTASDKQFMAPSMLHYCGTLMYDFTGTYFQKVSDGLEEDKQHFLYSVLASAGTKESLKFVLANIGKISVIQQVVIFGSLNTNLKSPESLRLILEMVKKQDMTSSPFVTSQILINFATLVHRVCGTTSPLSSLPSPPGVNSFSARLNRLQCDTDNIVPDLEAFLITELENSSQFWKQMVLVKALVNLKTIGATDALLPYILAKKQCDPMVRSIAMDALASWNAADYRVINEITHTLLDIYENPAESRELRSRALGYLASWPLQSTGWTRLAYNTWRPGVRDLSALTYSLIKAASEVQDPEMLQQRQFAQHALTQARPCTRAERYSSFNIWMKYNFFDQIGRLNYLSIFKDPASPLPSEIVAYMRRNLGGSIFHRKMEFMISNDDGDMEDIAIQLFRGKIRPGRDAPNTGRWSEYISLLKRDLNIEEKVRGMIRGLASSLRVSGMELFVPFETEMLQDAVVSFSSCSPYFFLENKASLYVNALEFSFMSVNDLGLPVMASSAMPMTFNFEGIMHFLNSGPFKYELYSERTRFLYARQSVVNLVVSVPPLGLQLTTGVGNNRVVHLPFSPYVQVLTEPKENVHNEPQNLVVSFNSSVDHKVAILSGENIPYIQVKDLTPLGYFELFPTIKIIHASDEEAAIYNEEKILPFNFDHQFSGDLRPPQTKEDVFDMITGKWGDVEKVLIMSPTAKHYSGKLMLHLENLATSSLKFNLTRSHLDRSPSAGKLVSMYGQDKFEDYELCGQTGGDFTQQSTGQQTGDYDYSQAAQSPQEEFESFGSFGSQQSAQTPARLTETQAETIRPSQGIGDLQKPQLGSFFDYLRQSSGWRERIDGYSLRMEVLHQGEMSHVAEAIYAKSVCYNLRDQKKSKHVIAFAVDNMPELNMCVDFDAIAPKFNDLDTLDTLRLKNLSMSFDMGVYTGLKCDKLVSTAKESIEADQNSVNSLYEKLKSKSCSQESSGDLLEEFLEEFRYDTVHLEHTALHKEFLQKHKTLYVASLLHGFILEKLTNMKIDPPCNTGKESYKLVLDAARTKEGKMTVYQRFDDGLPSKQTIKSVSHLKLFSDFTAADYCVVDPDHVHTFDGLVTNVTIEECPVLLATPCEKYEQEGFAIAVKRGRDGQLAVNIASEHTKLVISVDTRGVRINGDLMDPELYVKRIYFEHPWKYPYRRVGANIYRRNGFIKVEVLENFDVLVKEGKVFIRADDQFRGMMCGLCGNMDLEPSNDLVCPKNCALTNPDNFSKAWTPTTGFDCHVGYESGEDCLKVAEPLDENYYAPRSFGK